MVIQKILLNRPSKQFLYVNLAGWGVTTIINFSQQYFIYNQALEKAIFGLSIMAWGFIFTTGLRFCWGYCNIYDLDYKNLIFKLILHSIAVALLIDVIGIGSIFIIGNYEGHLVTLYIKNFFGIYPIILLWIAIYYGTIHTMSLRRKEIENLKLLNSFQTAQLSNLRNQLNPHFLFNSLNNIKSLIREDGEKARRMISSLTDILRYSLNSEKKHKVTVREEIAFVRDYLELEHLHIEERLHYEIRTDDKVNEYKIPPMIIQILAENGIKHGINQLPDGGIIIIEIERVGDRLFIRVSNSGRLAMEARRK